MTNRKGTKRQTMIGKSYTLSNTNATKGRWYPQVLRWRKSFLFH